MPRRRMPVVHTYAVAALALFIACAAPTDVRIDPRPCPPSFEFGNTGCADIEGVVTDAGHEGVPGMVVGARSLPGGEGLSGGYATTDAAGRFTLRITRYVGQPPATGPDTVSLYVHAADPRSAGPGTPATVQDSVLTRVTIAPVGEVPEPAAITIRLVSP